MQVRLACSLGAERHCWGFISIFVHMPHCLVMASDAVTLSEGEEMNLRHIQAFLAVAEELHFGRAARRLHIEQSPLSRIICKLEADLGVMLFKRTPREVRLTWEGRIFLEDAQRIVMAVDQAQARMSAAAEGYQGTLRIALSDGIGPARLSELLALCREEAPDVRIRLFELPLNQLLSGLSMDLFDAGLTLVGEVSDGIVASPLWQDRLVAAVPARHPLLAFKEVPLQEALNYPLVLCHPRACKGCSLQWERLLSAVAAQPQVAEYVTTHDLMLALVAAGYGVGLSSTAHLAGCRRADVVVRPLADPAASLTTYLLRPARAVTGPLRHFIDRAGRVGRL